MTMNADKLFKEVKSSVPELLENGQAEIIFGNYISEKFNVYTKSSNDEDIDIIEVEYNGETKDIHCENINNTEYVARLIMHCFAKLYLER
jgi:hypothetical protein